MKNRYFTLGLLCVWLLQVACKKDWLAAKYDIKTIVPTTLSDMRLLLNNTTVYQANTIGLGEIASDNLYVLAANLATATSQERAAYIWSENVYAGLTATADWDMPYNQILTANIVLEGLTNININQSNQTEWNDVKGAALFYRSKAFFDLLVMFTKPYGMQTAANDLGIPLKLNSAIAEPIKRASLSESYQQVVGDLKQAIDLLREKNAYPTDASKPAALGLLSRVYLSMGEFEAAKKCATDFLALNNTLIDFNEVNVTLARPFTRFNVETSYYGTLTNYGLFNTAYIEPKLIADYAANDLRLTAYFKSNSNGLFSFKGNYSGSTLLFSGLSPAEMLLTRAECNARTNQLDLALTDLNTLLQKRYAKASYVPVSNKNQADLMKLILNERRKELVYRGLRWIDLKRLAQEPAYAVTLNKTVDGKTYSLEPSSNRYAFAIPDYVLRFSNLTQNPR